ncbi:nitroreductase [Dokdonia sinensis]|uniref:Putative NAD(P)H nitroreductase n=1 Tax=Dokdonia sinensis TaxID=2479847 RepID=A0A3M0FUU3_9FLAO|nr:nitroreductase [Dokdonia sinensis]RMB56464.1 nitroreductase [Dokdonia sinensis]
MKILESIKNRRSHFPAEFIDKHIEKEKLRLLLEASQYAPSHKKTYPWRFKVVQGASQKDLGEFLAKTYESITPAEKFSDFKRNKLLNNPQKAGAIIAICMQRDPKERIPEWEEIASTAMAVQNMWLCLSDLGLGGYWSSPSLIAHAGTFLKLPEGQKCLGFFYVGYIDDTETTVRKQSSLEHNVEWI